MNELQSVVDLAMPDIERSHYDMAIFCTGFESRCTFFAEQIAKQGIRTRMTSVIGFAEDRADPQRLKNDARMKALLGTEQTIVSGSSDQPLYEVLFGVQSQESDTLRILLDITSMSRVWYSAVLNWSRFASSNHRVEVDIVYCVAEYEEDYPHRVISSISAIPGCEGYPDPRGEVIAIFGLGLDGLSPLAVLDDLEPDDILGFAAARDGQRVLDARTQEANQGLLDLFRDCLIFPLLSVQQTYAGLLEIVSPHVGNRNVVIIPLGPKSHVLSSILVSMKKPEVECLHIAGRSARKMYAQPTGEIAMARIVFASAASGA